MKNIYYNFHLQLTVLTLNTETGVCKKLHEPVPFFRHFNYLLTLKFKTHLSTDAPESHVDVISDTKESKNVSDVVNLNSNETISEHMKIHFSLESIKAATNPIMTMQANHQIGISNFFLTIVMHSHNPP